MSSPASSRTAHFLLLLLANPVTSYPSYQASIPNGDKVKDGNGDAAPGVGHERITGGGTKNQFGLDFMECPGPCKSWTKALCEMDSDKDGLSNGVELGDPNCVWSKGEAPAETTGISHPGIASSADLARARDTCEGPWRRRWTSSFQRTRCPRAGRPTLSSPSTSRS